MILIVIFWLVLCMQMAHSYKTIVICLIFGSFGFTAQGSSINACIFMSTLYLWVIINYDILIGSIRNMFCVYHLHTVGWCLDITI